MASPPGALCQADVAASTPGPGRDSPVAPSSVGGACLSVRGAGLSARGARMSVRAARMSVKGSTEGRGIRCSTVTLAWI